MARASPYPRARRALLLLLLIALPAFAAAWAPPYPIIESSGRHSLGLYVAWLDDPAGDLSIQQVAALPPGRFTVSDREDLHFGYTRHSYWFRVAIQNTRHNDETLLLEVPHPQLSIIEFYRESAGSYAATRSGTGSRRVVGDVDHQHYLFTALIPAGTTRVYWFRVQSDAPLTFSLYADKPATFSYQQGILQISVGILLGILLDRKSVV